MNKQKGLAFTEHMRCRFWMLGWVGECTSHGHTLYRQLVHVYDVPWRKNISVFFFIFSHGWVPLGQFLIMEYQSHSYYHCMCCAMPS